MYTNATITGSMDTLRAPRRTARALAWRGILAVCGGCCLLAVGCFGGDEPAPNGTQQTDDVDTGTTDTAGSTPPARITLPEGLPASEREAAKNFLALGGVLEQNIGGNVVLLDLTGTKVADEDLAHLQAFAELQSLILTDTKISNAGMMHMAGLSSLQTLELNRTSISDAGLEHVAGLSNLGGLYLKDTPVTDAGLERVGRLTNISVLSLSNTQISDAGLKHLRNLANLESLLLEETAVTEAGLLENLKGLERLQRVQLAGAQISPGGLQMLRQVLPNVHIVGP